VAEHRRQEREPVGSVAEETARLVEALGGWAEGLRAQHADDGAAHTAPTGRPDREPGPTDPGPSDEEPSDAGPSDGEPAHAGPTDAGPSDGGAGAGTTARCEHCGVSSRAGEALACRLCPVCQGIALLRTVRPETVERLADVAAALSGALRDIAADRFGQPPPAPHPPPPRGQRVQDIVVGDEDDDDDQGAPRASSGPPTAAPTAASRPRQESTAP
jgi:hypothetical protein